MKVVIDDVQYIPAPKPATSKGLDAALDVRFDSDAGSQLTVREYFTALLVTLWREEEGFSGKRPFGNSGWKSEVYRTLAKAGFIDIGPYSEDTDEFWQTTREQLRDADAYCLELIARALSRPPEGGIAISSED